MSQKAAVRQVGDFVAAVAASQEPIAHGLREGKQALAKDHAKKVLCADEARWCGSINLDATLKQVPQFAQASRWDYGLGYVDQTRREVAVWVEVHPAETSEVPVVLAKFAWLKQFLQGQCSHLWKLTNLGPPETRFVWIASGRYNIPKHMPQLKRLHTQGLAPPCGQLKLP